MAAINVKVPTKSVLASLKKKLAELQTQNKEYEKQNKAYEVARKAYEAQLQKFRPKGTPEVSIYMGWRSGDDSEVSLKYKVPKNQLPVEPKEPEIECVSDNTLAELESAIRILTMTEEQFVGASTFKAVTKFL
jgi:hypothetical protein